MINVCEYCGKKFKARKKIKLCSDQCTYLYRESKYKDLIKSKYPNYKYVGGYINSDSSIKIKCLKCGSILDISCISVRHNKPLICTNCLSIKREEDKKQKGLKQKLLLKIREEKDKRKQKERILKATKICPECGKQFINTKNKYCSIACKNKRNNRVKEIKRRHRLRENGEVDYSITLSKLIKRDKSICAICGNRVNNNADINSNDYPSIDHILPVAKGGTHTWGNVQLAHRGCNAAKSDSLMINDLKGQLKFCI